VAPVVAKARRKKEKRRFIALFSRVEKNDDRGENKDDGRRR
jgi:hypothetical protein